MKKKILHCVWFDSEDPKRPYVVITYTDFTHKVVYKGEKGYSAYKSAAMGKKK